MGCFLLFYSNKVKAQKIYPKGIFKSPVDSTVLLAGNFAELRPNHFHGGLDIKTQGQEGKNIYSIYDGYVSRIKISTRGYGKVLYITHPNGYVSVYAHLSKFSEKIEKYIKKFQYEKQTFEIELFPDKLDLVIKTSELIAYSGNTGGSSAPHLHFEIRNVDEKTINPLLFDFGVQDNINPSIYNLGIFPKGNQSFVNGKTEKIILRCTGKDGKYNIKNYKPITAWGEIGFGVSCLDFFTNSGNRFGIYKMEMYVDSVLVFKSQLDEVAFDETRYINSFVDYEIWKKSGMKIQKAYVDPGNKLNVYSNLENKGIVSVHEERTYKVKIITTDYHSNTSELEFEVIGKKQIQEISASSSKSQNITTKFFHYDIHNSYQNDECIVTIPEGRLYEDILFEYSSSKNVSKNFYSNIHHIHNTYTPLHKPITLVIKLTREAQDNSKLFVASIEGDRYTYEGGKVENGYITAQLKNFGSYAVLSDTIAPYIGVLKLPNSKNKNISFKISDNLSGISNYKLMISNYWLLAEYEYKNHTLTYTPDEYFPKIKGQQDLILEVTDKLGNKRVYKTKVIL